MSCNVFFEIVSKDSDKNAIKREQRENYFCFLPSVSISPSSIFSDGLRSARSYNKVPVAARFPF